MPEGDASTRDVSMCQGGPSIPRPHTARVEHAPLSMGQPGLAWHGPGANGSGGVRSDSMRHIPPPFAETDRPSPQLLHSSLVRTDDGRFGLSKAERSTALPRASGRPRAGRGVPSAPARPQQRHGSCTCTHGSVKIRADSDQSGVGTRATRAALKIVVMTSEICS